MNGNNRHLPPKDATSDYLNIVREYCKLASRRRLSEPETERLTQILKLAESDSHLDFWLNEADHFLAHELNLINDESIYTCENQQARLREYLDSALAREEGSQFSKKLKPNLSTSYEKLQQNLKERGFDPGPVDGILGPRTHSAILNFQKAHQLDASGIPDATTRAALGLS